LYKNSSKYIVDILTSIPISEDKWQESIFNRFDSFFNESQQEKFQEEISKTVSQIMKQAAHIIGEAIKSPQSNSMTSTKINSTEASSIQTPIFEMKNHNDIVQSMILTSKKDDDHHITPSKCIPLAEQLAQVKAKKLAALMESNNKDGRPLPSSEQESSVQKKFFPSTSDRLKQSFTHASSSSRINQFKNDQTSTKQNLFEKLRSAQVQQGSNNISSIARPIDKVITNPMSPSNTGFKNIYNIKSNNLLSDHKLDEIPSSSVINSLVNETVKTQAENKLLPLKEASNNQDSKTENQLVKPCSRTDKQINTDRLQQERSTLTSKLPTPTNVSLTKLGI
jgi:hypothetical protein